MNNYTSAIQITDNAWKLVVTGKKFLLCVQEAALDIMATICFFIAWKVALVFLASLGKNKKISNGALNRIEKEWGRICGGNVNNSQILLVKKSERSAQLKCKVALWSSAKNNGIYSSRWKATVCKYCCWLLLARGDYKMLDLLLLGRIFTIELAAEGFAGGALAIGGCYDE